MFEVDYVFYNKKKQMEEYENNKRYKKIAHNLNKIIDIILDDFIIRNSNNNGEYKFYANEKAIEISYETTIFGDQPRWQISVGKPDGYCAITSYFRYYNGEVYQFADRYDIINTYITELNPFENIHYFMESLQYLDDYNNTKEKIKKFVNNVDKIINPKENKFKSFFKNLFI